MSKLKIGILKECKTPPDERVPLTPSQANKLIQEFPCEVFVQKSNVRRIQDDEYEKVGIPLVDDVSNCDVLFGVKEVPKQNLLPNKTYFFFSHTIKMQPYNKSLLQEILKKNIRLIDYECLVNEKGVRVLGFGRYAGMVGAYNGFRMIGLKEKSYSLKKATECEDQIEFYQELEKVIKGNKRICITGRGRVAKGAIEILEYLQIKNVSVDSFLNESFDEPVYIELAVTDYNKRKDEREGSIPEFFKSPELYESDFDRFLACTDFYISCHYWDSNAPLIISKESLASENFKPKYISDISCDIAGPIASTIRPSTIEDPFYGVDRNTLEEKEFDDPNALAVMAVDNLPCELPIDASKDFGDQLIRSVIPALFNNDEEEILKRAIIAEGGKLTKRYSYLQEYVDGKS